ncbi:MAG: PKD domain-containing protein [Patescibacteria group bacterium]
MKYVFHNATDDDRSEATERVIFDGKKKDLAANIVITSPDSKDENFYAPTTIKFDGSASRTKDGTITKFIYDFGLGRPAAEGDAVQTIRYENPGEYEVSLTVVKDDGSKDTTTRKIIIKDIPKSLKINTSVSS